MERLLERMYVARKALNKFQELMALNNPTDVERDASIQRFEFAFEALWKTAKEALYKIEGVDEGSPKGVIRSCREIRLLNDKETIQALEMVNDRNMTVHTYNEALAREIYNRLADYALLMQNWLNRLQKKINT